MLFLDSVKKYVLLHMEKNSFCKRQVIELTLEEQKEYEDATYCHICKKVFGDKKKHCDNESLKNVKITCWTSNNKKLVRTSCKTCRSQKDQSYIALTKRFPCTFKLCRGNAEEFLLLLRKGVYPYEYMDNTLKFNEKELPTIDTFYSNLEFCGISTEDYHHAKKVCDLFKINNLGDYHDLHVCADTAQLSNVFENLPQFSV